MVHCNKIHGLSALPLTALLAFLMVGGVRSHTYLSALIINGNPLPQFDGIRPYPSFNKEYPLADVNIRTNGLNENDMICGFLPDAARPANRKITIAAGSTIGLQWWHNNPGDDVIAPSHKGPCMVYMAKSETGAGNVWFKIFEKGFDTSRRRWCVDDLIDARGVLSGITIPEDISPGNYLLRGEIIALHDASAPHGAQPYVHCVELTITGSGSANPDGVAMPGLYTDAALYINLYSSYNSFTIPGPKIYVAGSSPSPLPSPSSSSSSSPPATTTTTGSVPVSSTSTTGTPSPRRCRVSISQSATGSWTETGVPTTQYNVVMTNVGSSALDLKFRLSEAPHQMWNLAPDGDGTYELPSWMNGGLQPGQEFHWGYVVRSISPVTITLVAPACVVRQ